MAFNQNYLVRVGGGNGFNHYRYDTMDAHADVDDDGYFDTAEVLNMLKAGDLIDVIVWATAIRTGTISTYGRHIVMTNDGSTVDTSNVTVGVVTNSD